MVSKLEKGKVNYSVFIAPYELTKYSPEMFREKLFGNKFEPLLKESVIESSWGFCDINNATDIGFSGLLLGSYYTFAIRCDEYSFSESQAKPMLDAYCREHCVDWSTASKQIRTEVKDNIKRKIRSENMPKSKFIEVVYDSVTSSFYVFSKSSKAVAHCLDLLEKSFDIKLEYVSNTMRFAQNADPEFSASPELVLLNLFKRAMENTEIELAEDESFQILNDTEIKVQDSETGTEYKITAGNTEQVSVIDELIKNNRAIIKNLRMRIIKGQKDYCFNLESDRLMAEGILLPMSLSDAKFDIIMSRIDSLIILDMYIRALVAFSYKKQDQKHF